MAWTAGDFAGKSVCCFTLLDYRYPVDIAIAGSCKAARSRKNGVTFHNFGFALDKLSGSFRGAR